MDLDNAAAFMLGTIGYGVGFLVMVVVVVVTNNIVSKYWKPIQIFTSDSWNINPPVRFAEEHEIKKEPK
jgi:hypothetical protein